MDINMLLLLVSHEDPVDKYDAVHAQFFRENLLTCPKINSHHLAKLLNGQTSIFTSELLDLHNILRSCARQGAPCVIVTN